MHMRPHLLAAALLLAAVSFVPVMAQDAETGNTPGEAAAGMPAMPPVPPTPADDAVVAKVNGEDITFGQIEAELERVPDYQRAAYRIRALDMLMERTIQDQYIAAKGMKVDQEKYQQELDDLQKRYEDILERLARDVEKAKVNIRRGLILDDYTAQATSDEKVAEFIKAHPHFFDGSKIKVSHILIETKTSTSSEDQEAARKKLADIRQQIMDGKITFEDAAGEFSSCPSKAKGGDLGEIEPGGNMDPVFTVKAFETAEGDISEPFRTRFGWHIVKVTETNYGDGEPATTKVRGREMTPEELAKTTLEQIAQAQILDYAIKEFNIVNTGVIAPAPAPAPRPTPPAPPAPAPEKDAE